MNFEDELQDGLQVAGATIEVKDAGVAAVERRARRRSTRNRAAAGLGAFALVAGAIGGTYAFTNDGTDRVDSVADPAATAESSAAISNDEDSAASTLAQDSSRRGGAPGNINYGTIPLDWEVHDATGGVSLWNAQIAGDKIYATTFDGQLAVSSDLLSWTDVALPPELSTDGNLNGFINNFDVTGDVIAVAIELWDQGRFDGPILELQEENPDFAPPSYDPCQSGQRAESVIALSTDAGETWQSHSVNPTDVPQGRFYGDSASAYVATDGGSVLVGQEQYSSLNVECVLIEAGYDINELQSNNRGYGWSEKGVEFYEWTETSEEVTETVPWTELGLNEAELAAVQRNFESEEGNTTVIRLDFDGTITKLDIGTRFIGNLVAVEGEYLLSEFSNNGMSLSRSSDGGATWSSADLPGGFLRQSSGDVLIRESNFGNGLFVSTDAGVTWHDIGAPGGSWVQSVAVLGDTALVVGEAGNVDTGPEQDFPVEPFESTASIDGITIKLNVSQDGFAVTLIDDATNEVLLEGTVDLEALDSDEFDFGWFATVDGVVTFRNGDEIVAVFDQADLEAAFGDEEGRSSGSTGSVRVAPPIPVPASESPLTTDLTNVAVPEQSGPDGDDGESPVPETASTSSVETCSSDGECFVENTGESFTPERLLSYRGADGTWVSQDITDIVPGGGYAQNVLAFNGAYYVFIEGIPEFIDEPAADATADEAQAFDEERAFGNTKVLIGRP